MLDAAFAVGGTGAGPMTRDIDRRAVFARESDVAPRLRAHAGRVRDIAASCDAMCLAAGLELGDAVPSLHDLAAQFLSLATLLDGDDGASAAEDLAAVASEVGAIGVALTSERETLQGLIRLNGVLARRIDDLAHHIRFLSAVVSNVKIELSSIEENDLRLEGFAENFKQLTTKSQTTLNTFQSTHEKLIAHLKRTNKAQSLFEASHRSKLLTASQEIAASLDAMSRRRGVVATIANDIAATTRKIGADIAQSVVALQIGDCTRQRLEHVGDALGLAAALEDGDADGLDLGGAATSAAGQGAATIGAICALQSRQTAAAAQEFRLETRTILSALAQISAANIDLLSMSRDLVASPGRSSRSFFADLDHKLALARDLIGECGQSRKLVDETAEALVSSATELERLASSVAAMAIDMTIIGTNAVVTSYRLGSRGVALSVIAQHLRTHALRVADEVDRVRPVLAEVLTSARAFTGSRHAQDAAYMERLAARMSVALGTFRTSDQAVAQVQADLNAKVGAVGHTLKHATASLADAEGLAARLGSEERALGDLDAGGCGEADGAIADLLRSRYTMAAERRIHDDLFPQDRTCRPAVVEDETADILF